MSRKPNHPAPVFALPIQIVTLTTDFGLSDSYVAALKASILSQAPSAKLIDVTHQIPPQDLACGAIMLERAVDGFPPGTVHLAVVDPGVGTARRLLVVEIHKQLVVCPDNGLITWAWHRLGPGKAYELKWRPARQSHTFHGRDILGPAAGMLASGKQVREIAQRIDDPVLLDIVPAKAPARRGRIIHIDHYGNAMTNIPREAFAAGRKGKITVAGKRVGRPRRTYCDTAPGLALALFGSAGLLEIAVRDGSAAKALALHVGDEVVVE